MSVPIPPLDPDIAKLLEAERPIGPVAAEARARAFEAVLTQVAADPRWRDRDGASPFRRRLRGVGSTVIVFALGVATGVAWHASRHPSFPAPAEHPASPEPVPIAIPAASNATPLIVPVAPSVVPPEARVPADSKSAGARGAPAADPRDTLTAEQALVDAARHAVAANDGVLALVAIERHEREFPGGLLTEEREALAVRALVLVGRLPEAQARARRFHARYPHSLLVAAVDRAIARDTGDGR